MFETTKWHEGEQWTKMLSIYDDIVKGMFPVSRLVTTRFGDTQVHTAGDPNKKPTIVFFHGIATNSIMFGEWLFPELSKDYYCVAIDTMGDLGRSLPRDGDPGNGPQTDEEMAEWALKVFDELGIQHSVNILGYSFGCCIACCIARFHPESIDKLILMAPGGVLAPVRKVWLVQAITFAIFSKTGLFTKQLQDWFFGSMVADIESMKNLKYPELREASDAIGSPQVNIKPDALDVETLQMITANIPTLMIIGEEENVIDPKLAIENAKVSGMKVKVYENAGHMFFCEHPREPVIEEVKEFLECR
jgi:pimeloyl-ACP methyl ester carboxylesterase